MKVLGAWETEDKEDEEEEKRRRRRNKHVRNTVVQQYTITIRQ
jgi:hypothetical protein